jgi:hypothetical protein
MIACSMDVCHPELDCQHPAIPGACTVGDRCGVRGCEIATTFTEVYAVLATCSPCHTSSPGRANLDFTTRAVAYADLVGVDAECGGSGNVRVIAGDAMRSLLWRKVAGVDLCGAQMPNGGRMLDAATIDAIADWINAGAANN